MSPRRCIIEGCDSVAGQRQHQGVKFHKFPTNVATRKIWIENCRLLNSKNITTSTLVCSRHFRRADFQPVKNEKHVLKLGAVPTMFPWGNLPVHDIKSTTKSNDDDSTQDTENDSTTDEPTAPPPPPPKATASTCKKGNLRSKSLSAAEAANAAKQRSASAEEKNNSKTRVEKANARKSLDSATATVAKSDKTQSSGDASDKASSLTLVSGAKLEVQDLSGSWHRASVVEVDPNEQEVLINFENKSKGSTMTDEWIRMNSSRLRPIESEASNEKDKKSESLFLEGERCLARWTDSRKFPATVQKVLDNNMFEVLFDDGFPKTVKGSHMSKLRRSAADKSTPASSPVATIPAVSPTPSPVTPILKKQTKPHPIPKFDMSKFNLPEIPSDGEWCCQWVNDTPIGREGHLTNADGNKRPTVLVDDWRLPNGWTKHLYQRSSVSGKWDVVLVGPNNKRFRSKNDVKAYLDEQGLIYNPDVYDFSIHKRRAKDLGVYVYTDDYVPPAVPKSGTDYSKIEANLSAKGDMSESFTGFSPHETSSLAILSSTTDFSANLTPTSTSARPPDVSNTLDEGFIYVGALKVQIIDNLYRCPKGGCNKNFRKENHLQIHVKHYHDELSKQLGACPNMTELAYFRTMGTPIDEAAVKLATSGSSIEKTLQSEKQMSRKSSIAEIKSETDVKAEIISPTTTASSTVGSTANENLKRKAETVIHIGDMKEKRKSSAVEMAMLDDVPLKSEGSIEAQVEVETGRKSSDNKDSTRPQIHRFKIGKVSKAGRKKGGKSFLKKFTRTQRKRDDFALNPPSFSAHVVDSPLPTIPELTRKVDNLPKRKQRLKFLQQSSLDSTSDSKVNGVSNNSFINENGEQIKIVRMRKEEIINCLCAFGEEDGLMIQCDLCLCWQHAGCNGIERACDVPDKYMCYVCRNPFLGRESMKYIHDQEWLYEGKLFHANYHKASTATPQRFEILKQSHKLSGNLLELKRSLHSLNVKINIASNKDHPKLYLWSKKWEDVSPKEIVTDQNIVKEEKLESKTQTETTSDQTVSIVDENCKSDKKINENDTMIVSTDESVTTAATTTDVSDYKEEAKNEKVASNENEEQNHSNAQQQTTPNIPEPEAAIEPVECQHRLLEHIQKEQSLMLTRMQAIDAEIVALEAMENRPSAISPDQDFVRTSQTIQMLLNDLLKLKKMAMINQTTINAANAAENHYVA